MRPLPVFLLIGGGCLVTAVWLDSPLSFLVYCFGTLGGCVGAYFTRES